MRDKVFWVLDKIKGNRVKSIYLNMKKNFNKNEQEEDLVKLLKYAKDNTEYYKNIKENEIEKFPVIDKNKIIENYNDFISKEYRKENLYKMFTSGSTGTPFTILQNTEKRNALIAELIYYGELCGFKFGSKQTYLRVWTEKLKKSKIQCFKQNLVMIDISDLSETRIKEIVLEIKKKKIKSILSFASTLDAIANYLEQIDAKPEEFKVESIISGAEALREDTRKKLEKRFGCNVISRYSNQENGVLGQECINNKEFHLNEKNYYFEFLEFDSDKAVKEGEVGRIVITDLQNKAMPMIRYDTGDTGIYAIKSKCGKTEKILKELYGRKIDVIYKTNGEKVSPFVISSNMLLIENIRQFKFIQESKTCYKILLNVEKEPNNLYKVEEILKDELGNDAMLTIEYVKEIPVLASGKRKYIENRVR